MHKDKFINSILATLKNGDRLLEDAKLMFDFERFPTCYALSVLAQEEYAKALLLSLVDAGAIPWSSDIMKVIRDHVCKQLVGIILDYLSPDIDEFLKRHNSSQIGKPRPIFPSHVLDAINVICNERIPKERERWWLDNSERPLDPKVKGVADGKYDRTKQRAIYLEIGKSGKVCSTPLLVSSEDAKGELDRSERIGNQLRPYDKKPGLPDDLNSEKLIVLFRLLTGGLSVEEFKTYWWVK